METTTIFPMQTVPQKNNAFYLEFRQLKEYFNFRRKFKVEKKDINKLGKPIQNEYYLIDKNWLNKWKEFVGYNKISALNLNRDMNDNDYHIFKQYLPKNLENNKLYPLDNSKIYNNNGDINSLAEFVIINKGCQKAFAESRQNMEYNIIEKSVPVKFLHDKIILNINSNIILICFRNDVNGMDEEIIVIFLTPNNKEKIIYEIEKEDFKGWLKNRNFEMDSPDEMEMDEQGCKLKIINKNLKLKMLLNKNTCKSGTTLVKFNLPENLKIQMQTVIQENLSKTMLQNMAKENEKKQQPNPFFNRNGQINYNNNNNNQNNQINYNSINNVNFMQQQNNQQQNMGVQFNNMMLNNRNFINGMMNNPNMNINQNMMMNNNMMQGNPNCMNNLQFNMNQNMAMSNQNLMNAPGGQQQMNFMNNFNNMNMHNLNMNNQNSCPNFQNNMNLNGQNNNQNRGNQKNESPFTTGITYPHKAGLLNVGQSCYMNATIECLSNIKSLSNNLLQKYGSYNIDKQPLCVSYSSLLYDLLHTTEKYIKPNLFKEIIGKLNPLFEGNHAADAKDLIFFIIETLHKELCPSLNNNNNEIDFLQQELNSQNEQKMLNDFLKEMQSNTTIISNLFYGINRSVMICNGCNITKYSFQTFNLLIFPLKKVKDYKMRKYGGGWFNNNLDLNLYDAFECEQEVERLEGDNMIYCNQCKKLSPGIHKQEIYGMPRILIIILNRGKNNQDFNEEFRFDQILDFNGKNIIYNQNSSKRFYLCGIITHLGESGSGGHFIAYCRNNPNDNFICYNDAAVSPVDINDAMACKISANDLEKKTPYILLYHYLK